jgi:hypothetical protein
MRIPNGAISSKEEPFMDCSTRLLPLSIIQNRDVYWEFVSQKQTIPNCANQWCNKYGIDNENWKSIYRFYSSIKNTRFKAFQFKILNNLLPCNLYLSRIGRSDTNKCAKCGALDDTVHYLYSCPESKIIWEQLSNWWQGLTKQYVVITERDTILGLTQKQERITMEGQLDTIILLVKWKIYAKKQMGESTGWNHILRSILSMIETLSFIASKNDKSIKHDKCWDEITNYLAQ